MNHTQRKTRSDATVEFMIRQNEGQTMWASNLSVVFMVGKPCQTVEGFILSANAVWECKMPDKKCRKNKRRLLGVIWGNNCGICGGLISGKKWTA